MLCNLSVSFEELGGVGIVCLWVGILEFIDVGGSG